MLDTFKAIPVGLLVVGSARTVSAMDNRPNRHPGNRRFCDSLTAAMTLAATTGAALLLPLVLGACAEPTPDEIDPSGTSGPINVTSTTFYEDGGGADETADGGEPPVVNGCLMEPHPQGFQGLQHQCDGFDVLQVDFNVTGVPGFNGPQSFLIALHFGPDQEDDSYEKPKVMACCEPYDDSLEVWEQEHQRACYHDLIENGCRSIVERILDLKKDAPLLAHAQINDLAAWFAAHTNDCYEEFWINSGASTFQATWNSFPSASHTWVLPSSADTTNVKDIEVLLGQSAIFDPFLPADPQDRILCDSSQDNNDVIFLEADPNGSFMFDLLDGDIQLDGTYASDPVSASAELASAATGCSVCSYLGFTASTSLGGPRMDALVLESEDPAGVSWSPTQLVATDRFRIALYDDVPAPLVGSRHWQIAAGEAHFVASGIGHSGSGALPMSNTTKIDIWYINSRYEIDPFELQYIDSSSEKWTVSVPSTAWN